MSYRGEFSGLGRRSPGEFGGQCLPHSRTYHAKQLRRVPGRHPSYLSQGSRPYDQGRIIIHLQRELLQRCCARNLEGSHHFPVEKGRQIVSIYLLIRTCQPRILSCQDNRENGAQPFTQPRRYNRMALSRTGWLPQATLQRRPNPQNHANH